MEGEIKKNPNHNLQQKFKDEFDFKGTDLTKEKEEEKSEEQPQEEEGEEAYPEEEDDEGEGDGFFDDYSNSNIQSE